MARNWRDRLELALQHAAEHTTTLRALASRGLQRGEQQLVQWQSQRQYGKQLAELGELVFRLHQAGHLHLVTTDRAVAAALYALESNQDAEATGATAASEPFDSGIVDADIMGEEHAFAREQGRESDRMTWQQRLAHWRDHEDEDGDVVSALPKHDRS